MWITVMTPFVLQAIAIGFDEYYFHWRRGLPLWERIGHPLDTLSLFICLLMIVLVPFTMTAFKVYIGLAIFSCLMVTKDEFVHKHHCPAAENWLHALLFLLHPITLACAAMIWPIIWHVETPWWISSWLDNPELLTTFMYCQTGAVLLFFLYQVLFWNFLWSSYPVKKN